mgnify:FL=1
MNPNFKMKIFQFLEKLVLISILLSVSTFIEIYWAMGSFSEKLSSGNPDSHFFDDAYLLSVFATILLTIAFLLFTLIKNNYFKTALELISLILVWFFWNYNIFVDRESAWSTYLFKEEILYTLTLSFFPILILSIATVFGLNYLLKKI